MSGKRVIIIAGTGVPPLLSKNIYGPLAKSINGDVEIVTLHNLGLSHTMKSVEHIKKYIDSGDTPLSLVGHSQGGVVASILGAQYPNIFSKIITIGAPLKGTVLCNYLMPAPGLRSMSQSSEVLKTIIALPKMHNIVGTRDKVVVPTESGLLEGANHHIMKRVTHTGLIYDSETRMLISKILDEVLID